MIAKKAKFILGVVMSLFFIVSCSIFSPVKNSVHQQFVLSQLPAVSVSPAHNAKVLMVMSPIIFSPFADNKIAYTQQKEQINFFTKSEWAANPADMLQLLLIQTLQKTKHFHAVVRSDFSTQYDVVLNIWVTELEEDLTGMLPVFKINLQAVLFDSVHHRVIANRNFHAEITLNNPSIQSAIISANQATAIILQQLARFCIEKI